MITFLWPLAALLLPLPYLARRVLPARAQGAAGAIRVPFFPALVGAGSSIGSARSWPALLATLVWILVVAALMRPTLVGEPAPLPAEGRDHGLKAVAGREGGVAPLDQLAEHAEEGVEIRLIRLGDVELTGPANHHRVVAEGLVKGGSAAQEVVGSDLLAAELSALREALDLVLAHGIAGLTGLEEEQLGRLLSHRLARSEGRF